MNPFKFDVCLRVVSYTDTPEAIIEALGMEPTFQHAKGAQRQTPKGAPLEGVYAETYCTFACPKIFPEETLPESLHRTISKLEKCSSFFDQIRSRNGRIEFFVGWYADGMSGETFSYDLLKTLGQLGVDLSLDVYGDLSSNPNAPS